MAWMMDDEGSTVKIKVAGWELSVGGLLANTVLLKISCLSLEHKSVKQF